MMKVIKKNSTSLAYLEEVRQHMARLPSIDPNTRTILVCGYPNVGKVFTPFKSSSSFRCSILLSILVHFIQFELLRLLLFLLPLVILLYDLLLTMENLVFVREQSHPRQRRGPALRLHD